LGITARRLYWLRRLTLSAIGGRLMSAPMMMLLRASRRRVKIDLAHDEAGGNRTRLTNTAIHRLGEVASRWRRSRWAANRASASAGICATAITDLDARAHRVRAAVEGNFGKVTVGGPAARF
jgi:hypothetical protein